VIWTLFGVFFLQLLDNSLRLMNVPFFVNDVVKGSVILLAAMLDVTRFQLRSRNY
jgi:ribose transport system permease protein